MKRNLFAAFLAVMLVMVLIVVVVPDAKAEDTMAFQKLTKDSTLEITKDTLLDLNGFNATVNVAKGVTLSVIDSGNNTKDGVTNAGVLTKTGEGTLAPFTQDPSTFDFPEGVTIALRFVAIENVDESGNKNGTYSFHPCNLTFSQAGLNNVSIENKKDIELCLRGTYFGNYKVIANVTEFGLCPVNEDGTYGEPINAKDAYDFAQDATTTHAFFNLNGSLAAVDNTSTYCAYMVIDGTTIYSSNFDITPREVLKNINKTGATPTENQKTKLDELLAKNERVANILRNISGKTCAHHGGTAASKMQAVCIDCDTGYGEYGIPEGAVMVTDFSSKITTHTLVPNSGTTSAATDNWHAVFNGAAGVQSFGTTSVSGGHNFLEWENILPKDFNYSDYTHITFRIYVASGTRILTLCDAYSNGVRVNEYDLLPLVTVGQWCYVTIPLAELKAFDLYLCNKQWQYGDLVYIDQVYVERIEKEIPEGATLVTDFSSNGTHTLVTNYGASEYATDNWHAAFNGAAGVQSFGMSGTRSNQNGYNYLEWENILPTNFDYSQYTYITFRIYVTYDVRELELCDAYANGTRVDKYDLLSKVTVGQWCDVTIPLADLKAFDLLVSNQPWKFGDLVYIDQAYVTRE